MFFFFSKSGRCFFGIFSWLLISVSVADSSVNAADNTLSSEFEFLLSLDINDQNFKADPWQFSLEFNDAGVDGEGELREVLSATKIGLFALDDYLYVGYETDSFQDFHSVSFSYESTPLFDSWVASIDSFFSIEQLDVQDTNASIDDLGMGIGLYLLNFHGNDNWFWQWGFGARLHALKSEDTPIYESHEKNEFFLPGVKWIFQGNPNEHIAMNGYLLYEWNEPKVMDTKEVATDVDVAIPFLTGQFINVDVKTDLQKRFHVLSGEYKATYSFLNDTKEQSKVSARIGGFTSFNDALLPQFQKSIGGLYSIRGYDDQVQSGDRVYEASLEWAYRIQSLELSHSQYQMWGFLFSDWAQVYRYEINVDVISDIALLSARRRVAEREIDLASWGLGFDVHYQQKSRLSLVWAKALKDDKVDTKAGDHRFHAYLRFHF